jgi:hypothetical protein
MSQVQNAEHVEVKAEVVGENAGAERAPETLVDAIFDVGLAWADFGIGQGKKALETSAKTLETVARSLEELRAKLRKDAA